MEMGKEEAPRARAERFPRSMSIYSSEARAQASASVRVGASPSGIATMQPPTLPSGEVQRMKREVGVFKFRILPVAVESGIGFRPRLLSPIDLQ
ncbi:hypothetical protein TSAR_012536 [Trichomalopsis sarcophagae]|uniref:Uncharacterized protein n=1 Tax=Trichomalopsis sarcophagae TaxID=543379 RepID=A0A232EUJ7_9HYME|nr:hypothetical protein TSAR_012536 [Trichomalopsis sarcophagae]